MSELHDQPDLQMKMAEFAADILMSQPMDEREPLMRAAKSLFDARAFSAGQTTRAFTQHFVGHLYASEAFDLLNQGKLFKARRRALQAVIQDPAQSRSRGVLSVATGWAFRNRKPDANGTTQNSFDSTSTFVVPVLSEIVAEVELCLGEPLSDIAFIGTGTYSRSKMYRIQVSQSRYILRVAGERGLRENVPVLQMVAQTGLAVPRVIAHDQVNDRWLVQEELEGRDFTQADLNITQAETCLTSIAGQLGRLHQIPTRGFGLLMDDGLQGEYDSLDAWLQAGYQGIEDTFVNSDYPVALLARLRQVLQTLRANGSGSMQPSVCHADLLGNVFVQDGRLAGMLDWGCAMGGEPAYDLAWAWLMIAVTFEERDVRDRLFAGFLRDYESVNLISPSPVATAKLQDRIQAYAWLIAFSVAGLAVATPEDERFVRACRKVICDLPQKSAVNGTHGIQGDAEKKVTIIITTYNQPKLLKETLDSLLAQTYRNIECIVIDDASTDDTPVMMQQYVGRVIYIRNEVNRGKYASINAVIPNTSGEYIGFLDHDDLFAPDKIEKQVKVLDARPEVGLVHCQYYYIDEHGHRIGHSSPAPVKEGFVLTDLLDDFYPIWASGFLVRRTCLDEVGLYDDHSPIDYVADFDLEARLARHYQFAAVQEPLGSYRRHSGGMSSASSKMEAGLVAVLDKVYVDPKVPDDVRAIRDKAYAICRMLSASMHYSAGKWNDAARNLEAALNLDAGWQNAPKKVISWLVGAALETGQPNPVAAIEMIFDHLPHNAAFLKWYSRHAQALVACQLSLRGYVVGDVETGRMRLCEAIHLDPSILTVDQEYVTQLVAHAQMLPAHQADAFIKLVFKHLPDEARSLHGEHNRIRGAVNIEHAFADHQAGRGGIVPAQVLKAIRYQPSLLRNRGVWSIMKKSVLA